MDWISILANLVIPVLGIVITYYVVPILREKNLYRYVNIGVYAAEQLFGSGTGAQKYAYVKNWVKQRFKISDSDLKTIIEAAVLEMNKIPW